MPRTYVFAVIVRVIKLGLWLGLIFLFLFSPAIIRMFYADQSLNVFVCPMTIDAHKIEAFEREKGVKVHINYYENNEELLHKIRMTKGQGYDLIMPADYVVETLVEEGLLKRIDKAKLNFYNDLNPLFLDHYFDKKNEYSIPYFVSIYGLGIDMDFFGNILPEQSWSLIFEQQQKVPYKIAMTDDPLRAVLIAGKYLYGDLSDIVREDRLNAIKSLLLRQKKMVEMYTDVRSEEPLAAKSCPVVLVISPDLARLKHDYHNIAFVVPKEGSFIAIDSFVIPATSTKNFLAYEFLNFVYSPEVLKYHSAKYGFCSTLKSVSTQEFDVFCPDKKLMSRLEFFKSDISKQYIDDLWIGLMAH
jgi:spermidine/putrescine-binding protein